MNCDEIEDLAGALALGAALPEEVEAARAHLATCPIGHPSVRELAATATLLADAAEPVTPPARLRERVLAAARADAGSAGGAPAATAERPMSEPPWPAGAAVAPEVAPTRLRPLPQAAARGRALPGWLAAAAVLVLAVGLGAWNVRLRDDLDGRDDRLAMQQQALDALTHGGQVVAFTAAPQAGGARGAILHPLQGRPVLVLRSVPDPGDKVYQLWAIRNGQPEDLGVFVPDSGGDYVATLPDLGRAEAVAITLEARRVPQPTTAPILTALLG